MNRFVKKWGLVASVLWRGDRQAGASSERADVTLGPLFEAFREGLPPRLQQTGWC